MAADSWGLSWGGDTGSWLASWARAFVAPPAAPTGPTPAGKATRKRYFVEIDGQRFNVNGIEEARQILQRAKALAVEVAEDQAERVERAVSLGKVAKVSVPAIKASPELAEVVYPYRKAIQQAYKDAADTAEIRALMALKMLQEDDDDLMVLLL